MKSNSRVLLLSALVATLVSNPLRAEDHEATTKAEAWKKAALSRNDAATVQQDEAARILDHTRRLRNKEYLYDSERQENLAKAGDAETTAGNLEAAASQNFDKAADNWLMAAGENSRINDSEKENHARQKASAASSNSLAALGRAVLCYELAADAYSENNANQPAKRAAVEEKAAAARAAIEQRQ